MNGYDHDRLAGVSITPLTPEEARMLTGWRYPPPYEVYSLSPGALPSLTDPAYRYHSVKDQSGDVVGYCCFGGDARVPGGEYRRGEPELLDLGVGLRPDLTGQGLGKILIDRVTGFASRWYEPSAVRVTIAAWNQRSLKAFQSCGYQFTVRFTRPEDGVEFIQLEKPLNASRQSGKKCSRSGDQTMHRDRRNNAERRTDV